MLLYILMILSSLTNNDKNEKIQQLNIDELEKIQVTNYNTYLKNFFKKTKKAEVELKSEMKKYELMISAFSEEEISKISECYEYLNRVLRLEDDFTISEQDKFYFKNEKMVFYGEENFLQDIDKNSINHEKSKYGIIFLNTYCRCCNYNEPYLIVPIKYSENEKNKYFILCRDYNKIDKFYEELEKHGFSNILTK